LVFQDRDWNRVPSAETTFEVDTDRASVLEETMDILSRDVHRTLVEEGYSFRTLTIKVRDIRFVTHTRSRTLDHPVSDYRNVRALSRELLAEFLDGRKIRLLGLRLSHLYRDRTVQATIQEYF
jgi:DNA polymerase IV (DinB-like DNA polymerase)